MSGSIRCKSDGRDNALIATAPADVAFHRFADLIVGWLLVAGQQRRRRHDLTSLAIAALRHTEFAPRLLDRVLTLGVKTLDGGNGLAGDIRHGDDAGAGRLAVKVDSAGPAESDAAAELRSSQAERVAQVPQERHRRIAVEYALLSVHTNIDHRSLRWR